MGYSPWGHKESDMTEHAHVHHDLHPASSGGHTQSLWQAAELGGVTPWQAPWGSLPTPGGGGDKAMLTVTRGPGRGGISLSGAGTLACFPHSGQAFPLSCNLSPPRHSQSGPYKPACVLEPPIVS